MTLIEFAKAVSQRGLVAATCTTRPGGGYQARKGNVVITWTPQNGWGTFVPLHEQWTLLGESPEECWLNETLYQWLEDRR